MLSLQFRARRLLSAILASALGATLAAVLGVSAGAAQSPPDRTGPAVSKSAGDTRFNVADRVALTHLIHGYAIEVDRFNIDGWFKLFTDDAVFSVGLPGMTPVEQTGEAFRSFWRTRFGEFERSGNRRKHLISNILFVGHVLSLALRVLSTVKCLAAPPSFSLSLSSSVSLSLSPPASTLKSPSSSSSSLLTRYLACGCVPVACPMSSSLGIAPPVITEYVHTSSTSSLSGTAAEMSRPERDGRGLVLLLRLFLPVECPGCSIVLSVCVLFSLAAYVLPCVRFLVLLVYVLLSPCVAKLCCYQLSLFARE